MMKDGPIRRLLRGQNEEEPFKKWDDERFHEWYDDVKHNVTGLSSLKYLFEDAFSDSKDLQERIRELEKEIDDYLRKKGIRPF